MSRNTKLHIMLGDDGTLCDFSGESVDGLNATDVWEDATCLRCLGIIRQNVDRSIRWYTGIISKGVVPPVFVNKGVSLGECISRLHEMKERLIVVDRQIEVVKGG